MKKKRFTEEQIIAVLKEHEAGMKTGDLARKQPADDTWTGQYLYDFVGI